MHIEAEVYKQTEPDAYGLQYLYRARTTLNGEVLIAAGETESMALYCLSKAITARLKNQTGQIPSDFHILAKST